ncbi:MAG: hypothetical protein NTY48_03140 [Candidatus Diapherotrites archaeon]|nr:hypothetical protein [Candidatus Diapherotrites archaeon]
MKKIINFNVMAIVLLLAGLFLFFGCTSDSNANQVFGQSSSQLQNYTLADVAAHNTPNDCWIAIDANVYNFSGMMSNPNNTQNTTLPNSSSHNSTTPNSLPANNFASQIVSQCGTDATEFFKNRNSLAGADFNSQRRDFNGSRPDFNGFRPDRNFPQGQRLSGTGGGNRNGGGFGRVLIGKIVQ